MYATPCEYRIKSDLTVLGLPLPLSYGTVRRSMRSVRSGSYSHVSTHTACDGRVADVADGVDGVDAVDV